MLLNNLTLHFAKQQQLHVKQNAVDLNGHILGLAQVNKAIQAAVINKFIYNNNYSFGTLAEITALRVFLRLLVLMFQLWLLQWNLRYL